MIRRMTASVAMVLVGILQGCTCGGARSDGGADTSVGTDALAASDAAGNDDAAAGSDSAAGGDAAPGSDASGTTTYRAVALIGGLDRIVIMRVDPAADSCVRLRLVAPAIGGGIAITTPAGWSVEYAEAATGATACDVSTPAGTATATSGTGSVTFGGTSPGGFYPCTVTVDATLDFPPPWPTPVETLLGTDIPVEGVGCP